VIDNNLTNLDEPLRSLKVSLPTENLSHGSTVKVESNPTPFILKRVLFKAPKLDRSLRIDPDYQVINLSPEISNDQNANSLLNMINSLNDNQSVIPSTNPSENINVQSNVYLNPDYYDEFGRPKYEDVVAYENQLRAEIELNTPLVSDKMDIVYLIAEFKDSQFEKSVEEVVQKYKFIRTVRRDGNCFYRSFMFRLFEELASKKDSKLYNQVVKVVEESKSLCERNNYQWLVFEDFYNTFISEWKFVFQLDPLNTAEYM
jgi:hypothetical protein